MNTICKLADRKAAKPKFAGPYGRYQLSILIGLAVTVLTGCPSQNIKQEYFDAVEVGAQPQTNLYTKLAGVPFSVDILMGYIQNNNQVAFQLTGAAASYGCMGGFYCETPIVELIDASTGCGSSGDSRKVVTLTSYNWSGAEHGRHTYTVSSPKAVANAAFRIYSSSTGHNATDCSTDSFTIRPAGFTVTTSPLSTATAVAGANISMTATAVNASGVTSTNYTGTPTINSGLLTDWTNTAIPVPSPQPSWSGAFGAAVNGVSTGSSFAYKDFGQLTIPVGALSDSTYVSSSNSGDDAGDCVGGSSSNTLTGNKYGCNIGNTAAVSTPRFVPHHYEVYHAFTPACGTFTYLGQSFSPSGVTLTIYAKNSGGGNLIRLTSGTAATSPSAPTNVPPHKPSITVSALNNGSAIANPLNLTTVNMNSPDWPVNTNWPTTESAGGQYVNSALTTTRPAITPPAAPPDYESFALRTTVNDADGRLITLCNGTAVSSTSCTSPTTILRYGILKLSDGLGAALIPANMQVAAQYWNGSAFVTNLADSCTSIKFNANTIAPGSYTGNLTGLTLKNASTTLASGVGGLMLASTGQKTGSAAIAIKLGSTDNNCISPAASGSGAGMNSLNGYLGGASCASAYAKDPSARVTFGTLKSPYIYRSEKY